jgi:hypothetical protein
MRKILIILFCTFTIASIAQTYKPVLSDGKEWIYATVDQYNRTDTTGYYTITVVGDTVINNYNCKKIIVQDEKNLYPNRTCVAYEDNGKVYKVKNGEFTLLFDIGLKEDDYIFDIQLVVAEGEIFINGLSHKILIIDSMVDHTADESVYKVIEGIGISKDEFISSFDLRSDRDFCILISCTENGKIIYKSTVYNEAGINSPIINNKVNNMLYDLKGIRITNPQKGNLYIHNGKKILYSNQ